MKVCVMLVRRRKFLIARIFLILLSCQEWVEEVMDVEGGKRFVVRVHEFATTKYQMQQELYGSWKTVTVYRS
jgi:hypothetical protein